jgi:hypothetical protein
MSWAGTGSILGTGLRQGNPRKWLTPPVLGIKKAANRATTQVMMKTGTLRVSRLGEPEIAGLIGQKQAMLKKPAIETMKWKRGITFPRKRWPSSHWGG